MSLEQPTPNQKANPKAKTGGKVSSVTETARLLDAALPKGVNQGDMRRRDGDTSIYRFYLQSAGLLSPIIITATMITLAFCDGFPSESHTYLVIAIFTNNKDLWLKWWAEDNAREPNAHLGKWLGVYTALGVGAGLSLVIGAW